MYKKKSNQKDEEGEQINVYMRIRPMRNQHSKKSLKILEKGNGVALHYKDKIHQLYFDGVFDDTYSQQKVF